MFIILVRKMFKRSSSRKQNKSRRGAVDGTEDEIRFGSGSGERVTMRTKAPVSAPQKSSIPVLMFPVLNHRMPVQLLQTLPGGVFWLSVATEEMNTMIHVTLAGVHIPDHLSTNKIEVEAAKLVDSHIACLTHMYETLELQGLVRTTDGLYTAELFIPGQQTSLNQLLLKHRLAKTGGGAPWSDQELEQIPQII